MRKRQAPESSTSAPPEPALHCVDPVWGGGQPGKACVWSGLQSTHGVLTGSQTSQQCGSVALSRRGKQGGEVLGPPRGDTMEPLMLPGEPSAC